MTTLSAPMLVVLGILATACAQILLKQSSFHGVMSTPWLGFVGIAAASYGLSFLLYSLVLRTYPLNKVYPTMTVAQIGIVTIYGLVIGESLDLRQAAGLALAVLAIYLILS
jgi:multidrug transporter EmrE-like cation transporter